MNKRSWFIHQAWWQTARTIYERLRMMNLTNLREALEAAEQQIVEAIGDLPIASLTINAILEDGAVVTQTSDYKEIEEDSGVDEL